MLNQESVRVKAEAVVMSPFKAIASPCILTGWSPSKRINVFAFKGLAAEPQQSPQKQEMLFGAIGRIGALPPLGRERIESEVSLSTFLKSSRSNKDDTHVPI